jgi:TolB protein
MRRVAIAVAAFAVLAGFSLAAPAQGSFPGRNGKIAFIERPAVGTPSDIYTVNPDGTGLVNITNTTGQEESDPAWSPDGRFIAFLRRDPDGSQFKDLYVMRADGTGLTHLPGPGPRRRGLDWSPDGQRLVFTQGDSLGVIKADGTGFDTISAGGVGAAFHPAWSPDGSRIAYTTYAGELNGLDIHTIRPDSTGVQTVTGTTNNDEQPDWSPDGTRIVFRRDQELLYTVKPDGTALTPVAGSEPDNAGHAWSPDRTRLAVARFIPGADWDIYTTSAAGGAPSPVWGGPAHSYEPDWQPVPFTGYARPKGATPIFTYLVPAYEACAAPNREHGPPLAFPSCSAPQPTSDWLTVGTADSNGQPTKSIGSVSLHTKPGDLATPPDEADIRVEVLISDVRNQSDLSDYGGELEARAHVRLTDKNNDFAPGGGTDPGTMVDIALFPLATPVSCVSTADPTIGAACNVTTTMDAQIPGAVKEGKRAIWEVGQVEVIDGGADGLLSTSGNTLFLKQGVFIP